MPIIKFGSQLEEDEKETGIISFGQDKDVSTGAITFGEKKDFKPKVTFKEPEEPTDRSRIKETIQRSIFGPIGDPVVQKALLGDIPFARKILPKSTRELKPEGKIEKTKFVGTRLTRDLLLLKGAGTLFKAGKTATLTQKVISGVKTGGAFGALTAGEEKPSEIAKEAGEAALLFGVFPLAGRGIAKGAEKFTKTTFGQKVIALEKRLAQKFMKKIKPVITTATTKARNLIFRRHSEIGKGEFESELFVRNIERNLSTAEREAIPFLREGTKVPKALNRPDLEAIVNTQKKRLAPAVKEIGDYLDDAHKFILEEQGTDVGFVENYIPRIWDVPKAKQKDVINWFVTRNQFLKKRAIGTIKEGVEKFNLTPKTLDVAKLIRTYDQFKIKTIANNKFVSGLMKLKGIDGKPLVQVSSKAPIDWVSVDHPVLRKTIGRLIGQEEAKQLILQRTPVKVAPEIAQEVRTILEQPFSSAGIRAFEAVNAFSKKLNLSLSLFHHTALTETGVATGIGKDIANMWNPRNLFRALRNRDYDIYKRIPLTKDAIKHGVQFGAISDVQRGRVKSLLDTQVLRTKNIPVIGKSLKVLRDFNDLWDRALWDYYHNGLKLYGYESLVQTSIKQNPNLPVGAIKREVGQFVNDTFGGQSWDLLLKSPRWQQQMQWLLLSPDWTLSTLRQAVSPFGTGAVSEVTRGIRKELGQRFWERGILYFWGGMNLLNKAISEAETGKGRWMWENAIGHETHLFAGFNEDGTEKYVRWGKQFRELPEFFIDPIKKLGAKLSPALRQFIEQFSGSSVGGFKKEFADKPFIAGLPSRAKNLLGLVAPFSIRGLSRSGDAISFALPVSRGASNFSIRKNFVDAIERKDIGKIRKVYISALNNNLDAEALFKQARSSVKSDITFDFKKDALEIVRRIKKLGREKGMEKIKEMEQSGTLTPQIKKQVIKILKEKGRVQEQKEAIGITF